MLIVISSVDHAPAELDAQTPIQVDLIRELPGPDRPDYWIGQTRCPIRWIANNLEKTVRYVVLGARWQGTRIEPGAHLPVGIAYVTDESLLQDVRLDFAKCAYVAVGIADVAPGEGVRQGKRPRGVPAGISGRFFGTGGGK